MASGPALPFIVVPMIANLKIFHQKKLKTGAIPSKIRGILGTKPIPAKKC